MASVAPPPVGGLRMEVACCDADHEGEWDGEWEECEVVADHGERCDVRIVEDGELCRGVPRRLMRAVTAAAPPTAAALKAAQPEPQPEPEPEPEGLRLFLPPQYRLLSRGPEQLEAPAHAEAPAQKRRRKEGELGKAVMDTWVECDKCKKWRRNPNSGGDVPGRWWCELNEDKRYASCSAPQEPWGAAEVARESSGGSSSGSSSGSSGGSSSGSGGSGGGGGGGGKKRRVSEASEASQQQRILHLGKFLESCGGKRAMIEGWHTRTEVRRERAHAQGACMPARSDMCACVCAACARARQCVHAVCTFHGARTA